jgi:uncharacterized protein (DUF4415 family)
MARKPIADDEAPEITAEMFAKMRPMKDVTPGMAEAIKALRGRPRIENPKQVVSIRMSAAAVKRWNRLDRKDRAKLVASLEKKIEKRA